MKGEWRVGRPRVRLMQVLDSSARFLAGINLGLGGALRIYTPRFEWNDIEPHLGCNFQGLDRNKSAANVYSLRYLRNDDTEVSATQGTSRPKSSNPKNHYQVRHKPRRPVPPAPSLSWDTPDSAVRVNCSGPLRPPFSSPPSRSG